MRKSFLLLLPAIGSFAEYWTSGHGSDSLYLVWIGAWFLVLSVLHLFTRGHRESVGSDAITAISAVGILYLGIIYRMQMEPAWVVGGICALASMRLLTLYDPRGTKELFTLSIILLAIPYITRLIGQYVYDLFALSIVCSVYILLACFIDAYKDEKRKAQQEAPRPQPDVRTVYHGIDGAARGHDIPFDMDEFERRFRDTAFG